MEVFKMNRSTLINSAMILLLAAAIGFAQPRRFQQNDDFVPGQGQGRAFAALNLTDEQQTKIDNLFLEFQKEMTPLRDKIRTLRNEYRLLVIDDKASTSFLQKKLDEISDLREKMELKRAEHHRQVRALLTDDQKVKFDAGFLNGRGPGRGGRGGMGRHPRMGQGFGPCFQQ